MRLIETFGAMIMAWVVAFGAIAVFGLVARAMYEAFMLGWGGLT